MATTDPGPLPVPSPGVRPRPRRARPGWPWLILVAFGVTILWAVRFAVAYLLVPTACVEGEWLLHLVGGVTLLASVAVLLLNLRWLKLGLEVPVRFFLLVGLASTSSSCWSRPSRARRCSSSTPARRGPSREPSRSAPARSLRCSSSRCSRWCSAPAATTRPRSRSATPTTAESCSSGTAAVRATSSAGSGRRSATSGRRLDDLAEQRIIAGSLPNTPEHVAAFIQDPQGTVPGTGMPNLGVSPGGCGRPRGVPARAPVMTVAPDPSLVLAVVVAGLLYLRGWQRRPGRGADARTAGELGRFVVGLVVVLVALSPAAEQLAGRSFAWHMVQHQLLVLLAAPLLASARPLLAALHASRRRVLDPDAALAGSQRSGQLPRAAGWLAVGAGAVHLCTMLAWHLPPLYDAAMADARLHHLEHLSLLGTAVVAWGAILLAARDRGARALAAVVGLAMNALAGAGLGVVLLSAPVPLYGWYAELGAVALDQQRVGGALMKVSAVVVYAGAAVWIVTRWLQRLAADPDGDGAPSPHPASMDVGRG
jgi:putative membrane protein